MRKAALLYTRVSTQGQEDGTSLDSQEAACIQHAEKLGYTVARVTRETYSGAEWDRPHFSRDLADIRAKQFDAVICYAIDRLSREMGQLAYIALECEKADTLLLFVTEDLDQSPSGKLLRSVLSFVAEVEREKIRERSVRGKRSRAEAGKLHNAGPELYGYRRNKELGLRESYEPEARIVREIFQMVIDGMGVRTIRNKLNAGHVPAPGTSRVYRDGRQPLWCKSGIRRIIKHEAYKGQATAWKWQRVKRKIRERSAEERINLPDGLVPPIVTPEQWALAQQRFEMNGGELARNQTRPRLLRGRVYCSVCGNRMYTDTERYRCSSREKRTGKCGGAPVSIVACEEWAWQTVSTAIEDPKRIEKALRKLRSNAGQPRILAEVTEHRKELERLERGQQRLLRKYREADESLIDLIDAELKRTTQEVTRAREGLAALESKLDIRAKATVNFAALSTFLEQVRTRLAGFGFEDKRLALQALGVAMYANGTTWRLDMSFGDGGVSPSYSDSAQNSCVISFHHAA